VSADTAEPPAEPPAGPVSIFDALQPPSGNRSLRRLPRLVGWALGLVWQAARREVITAAVWQVLGAVALAGQLFIARSFLASLLGDSASAERLADVVPQLLGLGLITAVGGFSTAVVRERRFLLGELTARHAMGRLLDVAAAVDLEAFEVPAFHDQLLRATVNAQIRPSQLATGLLDMTSGLVGVLGVGVALASIEPLVLPVMALAFVPLWLASTRNSEALYKLSVGLTPSDRERGYIQQTLVGKDEAKELRAFQLGGFLRARYDKHYDDRIARLRALVRMRERRALLATAGAAAVTLVALGGLVQFTLSGRISIATAGAAALGVQQLTSRLRGIFGGASSLYECSLFLEDVTSFLTLEPAVPAGGACAPPLPFTGIRVEGLRFTYPGTEREVLREIDLEIGRGEVVALVGENGSGKTTLVKLLCGLYRPTAGRILWGDDDLADLDPEAVRAQVAVIFQDFLCYQLSAAANIGMGRHERFGDLDAVKAAARATGADRYLTELPLGYDTLLSRAFLGGSELSIGQWQRVALARAMFRDAPLVVLDEPSAALDARAEHELFERGRDIFGDRAVLLISHRFSSVRRADRIYVLQGGTIVESGDHQSLVAARSHYAQLFELQAAAYRDP